MAEYIERRKVSDACYAVFEDVVRDPQNLTADEVRQTLLRFEKAINSVSFADVATVRHGRWKPVLEGVWNLPTPVLVGWRCSECGRTEQEKEPYCNCGAKMDLEGGDGDGQRF